MNSTRIQFRLSQADRRAIALRLPPGLDLSTWLRQLALGEPAHRSRAPAAPHPTSRCSQMLSAADRVRANAQASVAIQLSDLTRRCTSGPARLSPELEAELRELAGQVRAKLLS